MVSLHSVLTALPPMARSCTKALGSLLFITVPLNLLECSALLLTACMQVNRHWEEYILVDSLLLLSLRLFYCSFLLPWLIQRVNFSQIRNHTLVLTSCSCIQGEFWDPLVGCVANMHCSALELTGIHVCGHLSPLMVWVCLGPQGAAFLIHPQGRSSVLVYIVPGVGLESPRALAEQDEWELAKRGTLLREKLKTSRTQLQYPSGTWK